MPLYIVWIACLMLCLSCQYKEAEKINNYATEPTSCNLKQYLKFVQTAEAGQPITDCFHQQFCCPIFSKLAPFECLNEAKYYVGELLYKDSNIVIVSFYYEAQWGQNNAKASIIASYQYPQGVLIDAALQFANAVFDYEDSLGYQIGVSFRSSQESSTEDNKLLLQQCSSKKFKRKSNTARFETVLADDQWIRSIYKDGQIEITQ